MKYSLAEGGSKAHLKKSKIYLLGSLEYSVRRALDEIKRDKVTVYAAQASFFVLTSAVPFISILVAIASIFLPETFDFSLYGIPSDVSAAAGDNTSGVGGIVSLLLSEIKTAPGVSLVSFSAVTTLWTASHGINAIRSGIESVYHVESGKGYVASSLVSLATTLLFIITLTLLSAFLLFGDSLLSLIGGKLSEVIGSLRVPFLGFVMVLLFTAIYFYSARGSGSVRHSFFSHSPGALFSSVGWLVFSFIYSYYITNFPGASRVYGSFAAVCLIMLWIYFCMIILLLGAELNKLLAVLHFRRSASRQRLGEIEKAADSDDGTSK